MAKNSFKLELHSSEYIEALYVDGKRVYETDMGDALLNFLTKCAPTKEHPLSIAAFSHHYHENNHIDRYVRTHNEFPRDLADFNLIELEEILENLAVQEETFQSFANEQLNKIEELKARMAKLKKNE